MDIKKIKIRLMRKDDYDAVLQIDEKILNTSRKAYYNEKFEKFVTSRDYVPTSLVAEDENKKVLGFIIGALFIGEFGIYQETAKLDTIAVDPDYRHQGIGKLLINDFFKHLKTLGVKKVHTLVKWNNSQLIHFFGDNEFRPSEIINLVRNI
ncbi:MAG: GNAT family N-acetyltransferase [Spirochaetes bacterium]|nr:GNAT family N-acetyltransferase [Spirochaetota bacterium]